MASIGHIAVGLAGSRLHGRHQALHAGVIAAVFWSLLSMFPDADVIAFRFGIAYADAWGHRGATHSLVFAGLIALMLGLSAPWFGAPRLRTGVIALVVVASHGILDTMTDGGLGCALFWPFDDTRYFAPWRPIPVAPLGLAFVSARGLTVAAAELIMFLPFLLYAMWPGSRTGSRL